MTQSTRPSFVLVALGPGPSLTVHKVLRPAPADLLDARHRDPAAGAARRWSSPTRTAAVSTPPSQGCCALPSAPMSADHLARRRQKLPQECATGIPASIRTATRPADQAIPGLLRRFQEGSPAPGSGCEHPHPADTPSHYHGRPSGNLRFVLRRDGFITRAAAAKLEAQLPGSAAGLIPFPPHRPRRSGASGPCMCGMSSSGRPR